VGTEEIASSANEPVIGIIRRPNRMDALNKLSPVSKSKEF